MACLYMRTSVYVRNSTVRYIVGGTCYVPYTNDSHAMIVYCGKLQLYMNTHIQLHIYIRSFRLRMQQHICIYSFTLLYQQNLIAGFYQAYTDNSIVFTLQAINCTTAVLYICIYTGVVRSLVRIYAQKLASQRAARSTMLVPVAGPED